MPRRDVSPAPPRGRSVATTSPAKPPTVPPASTALHRLQRTIGNQAVCRMLSMIPGRAVDAPVGPVVQRRLVVDGVALGEYSDLPEQATTSILAGTKQPPFAVQAVIEAMIDDPMVMRRSVDDLILEIPRVCTLAWGEDEKALAGTDDAARIARRMKEDQAQHTRLQNTLPKVVGRPFPGGRQLRPVNEFFAAHPALARLLSDAGIWISFGTAPKTFGGLYVHDKLTIHTDPMISDSPPSVFLRLLLHEVGHATFERMLLGEGDQLLAVPGDAQTLHAAWNVLRQNSGRYMLGLSLGEGRSATERKSYQARTFAEFCAECFMMRIADPDRLNHYVRHINSPRNPIPSEVRQAWRDVVVILDTYERRIMRG